MNKYRNFSTAKRRRKCERKKRFPTEAAAFQKNQEIYKCGYCAGWHRSGSLATLVAKVKK